MPRLPWTMALVTASIRAIITFIARLACSAPHIVARRTR